MISVTFTLIIFISGFLMGVILGDIIGGEK